jgi:hypothetical protein
MTDTGWGRSSPVPVPRAGRVSPMEHTSKRVVAHPDPVDATTNTLCSRSSEWARDSWEIAQAHDDRLLPYVKGPKDEQLDRRHRVA